MIKAMVILAALVGYAVLLLLSRCTDGQKPAGEYARYLNGVIEEKRPDRAELVLKLDDFAQHGFGAGEEVLVELKETHYEVLEEELGEDFRVGSHVTVEGFPHRSVDGEEPFSGLDVWRFGDV